MSSQGNRRPLCSVWECVEWVSISWHGSAVDTQCRGAVTPVLPFASVLTLRF